MYINGEVVDFIFDEPLDLITAGVVTETQQMIKGVVVSIIVQLTVQNIAKNINTYRH